MCDHGSPQFPVFLFCFVLSNYKLVKYCYSFIFLLHYAQWVLNSPNLFPRYASKINCHFLIASSIFFVVLIRLKTFLLPPWTKNRVHKKEKKSCSSVRIQVKASISNTDFQDKQAGSLCLENWRNIIFLSMVLCPYMWKLYLFGDQTIHQFEQLWLVSQTVCDEL